jgi:hypothetical protein
MRTPAPVHNRGDRGYASTDPRTHNRVGPRRLCTGALALVALALATPARAEQWSAPDRVDVALLVAVEALIVVDAGQTIHACRDPFAVMCEQGLGLVFMGSHPSTEAIYAWSGAAMLATAAIWIALPDGWRQTFTITAGIGELANVAGNGIRVGVHLAF